MSKVRWRRSMSHSSKRSEEHTSELQSPDHLVCRLLLEKKKKIAEHTIRGSFRFSNAVEIGVNMTEVDVQLCAQIVNGRLSAGADYCVCTANDTPRACYT